MRSETARRAPRISVVVTNFNYGHFLRACVESVLAQTRPADEFIIVDDGSTDTSRSVLAELRGVQVILQENRGQAAAFNAGFAASSGEAVLFLDADDLLLPQALEVLSRMWTPGIAGLSYDLEAVDVGGVPCGRYPMRGRWSDDRQRLLKELAVDFMPTSGNLLARAAIEWALPLPEERWRISADALLIRAAMLKAPLRHLPQTLAQYRMHGHNNYYDDGFATLWQRRRGNSDIADAGLALAELAGGDRAPDLRSVRSLLLCAAARRRLVADGLGARRRSLSGFYVRLARFALLAGEVRLSVLFLISALVLPVSARLRRQALDRTARPGWVRAVVGWLKSGISGLSRTFLEAPVVVEAPVWRAEKANLEQLCAGDGWHWSFAAPVALVGRRARFRLHRLAEGAGQLTLDLEPVGRKQPLTVSISRDGALLERFEIAGRCLCTSLLPGVGHPGAVPETFEIGVDYPGLPHPFAAGGHLYLHCVSLDPAPLASTGAVLPAGDHRPFHEVEGIVSRRNAALAAEEAAGTLLLPLARPHAVGRVMLSLRFGAGQCSGWLDAYQDGGAVWSGQVGPNAAILVPISSASDKVGELLLTLCFQDADPMGQGGVEIAALGWAGAPDTRDGLPLLSPGEYRGVLTEGALPPLLGPGWTIPEDGVPVFLGADATIRFAQAAPDQKAGSAVLEVEPAGTVPDGFDLVLGIDGPEGPAKLIRLVGQHRVNLALGGASGPGGGICEIGLHAAFRQDGADPSALEAHCGVRLTGLALDPAPGRTGAVWAEPAEVPQGRFPMLVQAATEAIGQGKDADLSILRDALMDEVAGMAPRALPSFLLPGVIESLAAVGARCMLLKAALPLPGNTEAVEWLRYLALAALSGPAPHSCPDISLAILPPLSPDMSLVVGRYLAANLDPAHMALCHDQIALLKRLLGEARGLIVAADPASAGCILAKVFVQNVRPNQLLFADVKLSGLIRAFGRSLEVLLISQGAELIRPPSKARAPGLPRTGILLRGLADTPERRILTAFLSELPPDRFDVTIFVVEAGRSDGTEINGRTTVFLAGLPLAAAVATIRSHDLDVMLLGSFFLGFDDMTQIAAHRLARRQIAMSAVFPVTTGLSATDLFILGDETSPQGCEADYVEACERAPGTGQIFADAGTAGSGYRAIARARLGIAADAPVFVSGAMADKIGEELIDAWVRILAQAKDAELVLYPFAPNWKRTYDRRRFLGRLEAAALRHDVAMSRVHVLAPITRAEVAGVLGMADIYLDSFPYSGATTTVEALTAGLPVVARTGRSQRGHQAAGWLAAFGLSELTGADTDGYIGLAVRLATDPAFRAAAVATAGRHRDDAARQEAFRDWLPDFLGRGVTVEAAPRYLFHHLPKSGGTSVRQTLKSWFSVLRDYREPWANGLPPPRDLSAFGPKDLLAGHFAADGMPLSVRYPETADTRRWRRFTFLRDPLELALSNYFFERQQRPAHDPHFVAVPLGQYLRTYPGLYLHHFECRLDNWREVLGGYWFIGTLERLPECMDWLAGQFGVPPPADLCWENASERDEQPAPEDVEIFARNMAHEFEIYRWVSHRLDACLASSRSISSAAEKRGVQPG